MAHVITLEIEEGFTDSCKVCPFANHDTEGCGLPESFPDCDEVNYAEMQVINN